MSKIVISQEKIDKIAQDIVQELHNKATDYDSYDYGLPYAILPELIECVKQRLFIANEE